MKGGTEMKPNERKQFFQEHRQTLTRSQMASVLSVGEPTIRNYEKEFGPCLPEAERQVEPEEQVSNKKKLKKLTESEGKQKKQIRALIEENEKLERDLEAVTELDAHKPKLRIRKRKNVKKTESTFVVLASDWHVGKFVDPEVVPGNEFNLQIARERVERFFQNTVKMLHAEQREVRIKKMVLALLGDFIEGDLHIDSSETSETQPMQTAILAYDLIVAGIDYLLANTEVDIYVPCLVGNHSRTTDKVRNATEIGHSLEFFIYHLLAQHYASETRITFNISRSVHLYMEVYGETLRFMHGHHGLRGGNGVGGLAIPLLRAIGKWNRTRTAGLTLLGHFHNVLDVEVGLVNGALCGYDAFAMSKGFPFAKPSQVYFLINSKFGRTGYTKIFLEG